MTFLTNLGVIEILCSLRLVLQSETDNKIPVLSRSEFLEKISANNFASSDTLMFYQISFNIESFDQLRRN